MLDNPPFSILASIVDWYNARGVRFFLFAPHLTLFNYCNRDGVTAIVADARIVYANGAKVKTSFVTNCYPGAPSFVVAGDLCLRVQEADRLARNEQRPQPKPQLEYPPQLVNAAILGKLCQRGIRLSAPRGETHFIRRLDSGRSIFGAGFLLSDRMARERTQAEKRARQHQLAGTVENYTPHEEELLPGPEMVTLALSDREREIIASLSGE